MHISKARIAPNTTRILRAAVLAIPLLVLRAPSPCLASTTQVFGTDFNGSLPAEVSAPGAVLGGVQGYAGLGPSGHAFGGTFLHYTSVPILPTTLTLTNLPAHDSVDLDFLMAVIDSWDGTELFQVRVDGTLLFNHWFQLATGDSSDYIAPPGGLLSRGSDLGFSAGGYWSHDRAYDMSVEPVFHAIPHTAGTLTVEWTISAVAGPAADQWQGGTDESWAIDELRVSVNDATAGVTPGGPLALSISGAVPNPAPRGALALRFTLPAARPASLEVMDTMGRRVFSSDVGMLGAGEHRLDVGRQVNLAPGVYLVRLRQGSEARQQRVIVLD